MARSGIKGYFILSSGNTKILVDNVEEKIQGSYSCVEVDQQDSL